MWGTRCRLLFFLFQQLRKVQLCKWTVICSGHRSYEKRWRQWFRWRPQLLMSIAAASFSFHENGISDETMVAEARMDVQSSEDEWEVVRNEKNSKVLRRLHVDTGLYEFRCSGSYNDITASDFVDAQMDLVFRKKWDTNVEKLELVEKDENTDSELIHWIAKFPYPMYPREYVFVRRRYIDEKDRCIVIANCAVANSANIIPLCEKKYVRIETYRSVMVVRAHESFDCKGFDYVLSYYDNPESNIPKYAYNWLINHGGPYYLDQVHNAAKELERQRASAVFDNDDELGGGVRAKKPPVEVSREELSDEREEKKEVDGVQLRATVGTENDSNEEGSETTDAADMESDTTPPASNVVAYSEKPEPVHLRECFVFID